MRVGGTILRLVTKLAKVNASKCIGCRTCASICPVEAISMQKKDKRSIAVIKDENCAGCTICFARCPEKAIDMVERDAVIEIRTPYEDIPPDEVAALCARAHMYPDQIVCYCHRVQAKEIAAAIILGAKTPEDVARMTGARTGCGVLCIGGMIRLLKAGGIELDKASGYQWYDSKLTIWEIQSEVQQKYPEYYLREDLEAINEAFPGGRERK
jgi:ferredoxin